VQAPRTKGEATTRRTRAGQGVRAGLTATAQGKSAVALLRSRLLGARAPVAVCAKSSL